MNGDTRRNDQGAQIDGTSLVPLMINPTLQDWGGPEGALTAIHKWKDMDPMMQNYSLRTKDWRYIRYYTCLLYTSPSPRDGTSSRMPSSA